MENFGNREASEIKKSKFGKDSLLLGKGRKLELVKGFWKRAISEKRPLKDRSNDLILVLEATKNNNFISFESLGIRKEEFDKLYIEVAIGLLKEIEDTCDFSKSVNLGFMFLKRKSLYDEIGIKHEYIKALKKRCTDKHEEEKKNKRGLF